MRASIRMAYSHSQSETTPQDELAGHIREYQINVIATPCGEAEHATHTRIPMAKVMLFNGHGS